LEVLVDRRILIDDEDAAFRRALFRVHRMGSDRVKGDSGVSEVGADERRGILGEAGVACPLMKERVKSP
jgi:hypothetical protein